MRILVLGSTGMLGHKMVERLQRYFPDNDVQGLSRGDGLNPENPQNIHQFLSFFRPEVVINCIGVVKQRSQNAEESIAVNALFPHHLKRVCSYIGARLIHFSTDCVFSGTAGQYREEDTPDPQDLYGRTKLLGEVTGSNVLTLRTSIIGRERSNYRGLLEWFLKQSGEIEGYENAIFTGVTTNWLADVVACLITKPLSGLYHIAAPPVTKYQLLQMFKKVYQRDVQIKRALLPVDCDRSLRAEKFLHATCIGTPTLEQMIAVQREQDKEKYAL